MPLMRSYYHVICFLLLVWLLLSEKLSSSLIHLFIPLPWFQKFWILFTVLVRDSMVPITYYHTSDPRLIEVGLFTLMMTKFFFSSPNPSVPDNIKSNHNLLEFKKIGAVAYKLWRNITNRVFFFLSGSLKGIK